MEDTFEHILEMIKDDTKNGIIYDFSLGYDGPITSAEYYDITKEIEE